MSQRVIYPLERRNGLLFVRVSVGTGVTPPVVARLLVDTGSSYTVLSTQILVRSGCEIPRSPRLISITAASGVVQVPRLKVPLFNALGRLQVDYEVVALDLPRSAGVDGLLGIDFLMLCDATIEVRRSQIVMGT